MGRTENDHPVLLNCEELCIFQLIVLVLRPTALINLISSSRHVINPLHTTCPHQTTDRQSWELAGEHLAAKEQEDMFLRS